MAPTHSILLVTSGLLKSKANTINNIMDINGWINKRDKNILSHALKNHEVELLINVNNAKGVSNSNTFIIIKRNE